MAENNIEKNSNIEEINEDTVSESKVAGNSEKQEKPKTTKTTTHKSGAKKSTTTSKTKKSSKENSSTAKKTSSSRIGKNTKKEIAIEEPVKANTKTKSKTTKKGASKTNTTKTNTTKKTTTPTEKKTNAKKTTKSGNTNKVEKSKAVKKSKKTDDRIKQIINEQLDNVDKFEEVKEVPAKKKKDKKKIDEKQIEEKIEKDKKMKIYKKVFANIILGIVVTLYFIGIGIGFLNIDGPTFITDLKVFSLSILTIAIILFEFAYGKDDDKTALYGVEMLFVAIMSLVLLYTCILHKDKFIAVANIVACIGVLYYLVKSISIYIREKLKWKKTISDVKEIVAEE